MTERFLPQPEITAAAEISTTHLNPAEAESQLVYSTTTEDALAVQESALEEESEPVAGFTEAEFEESYKRLAPSIIGHLASKGVPVQNAEDIVQESFFAIWRARHRLQDLPHSSYFFRAAINQRISSTRKQHPTPVLEENLPLEPVFDDTSYVERTVDTRRSIRQQPEHFHAIGELLMMDFSYQEIGEILGINPTTVRTRTNRLRKYLAASKAAARKPGSGKKSKAADSN